MNTRGLVVQEVTHMLVDTANGLRIVVANPRNFTNTDYAVQFTGTKVECEVEMRYLKNLERMLTS